LFGLLSVNRVPTNTCIIYGLTVHFSYGSFNVLGFLLRPFARKSDGLPFTGTILLDSTYFKNSLASGDAGKLVLIYFSPLPVA
jgi:hypothetical protein